jgi:hypothetical protein
MAKGLAKRTTPTKRVAKHLGQTPFSAFTMAAMIREEIESAGQQFKAAGLKMSLYKIIADDSGLSEGTVRKLATGETLWPRLTTVIVLFEYFGFDIIAERDGKRRSIL